MEKLELDLVSHLDLVGHLDVVDDLDLVFLRLNLYIFHQHTLYSAEDGGMSGEPAEDREQGQWTDCGGCSAAWTRCKVELK